MWGEGECDVLTSTRPAQALLCNVRIPCRQNDDMADLIVFSL